MAHCWKLGQVLVANCSIVAQCKASTFVEFLVVEKNDNRAFSYDQLKLNNALIYASFRRTDHLLLIVCTCWSTSRGLRTGKKSQRNRIETCLLRIRRAAAWAGGSHLNETKLGERLKIVPSGRWLIENAQFFTRATSTILNRTYCSLFMFMKIKTVRVCNFIMDNF